MSRFDLQARFAGSGDRIGLLFRELLCSQVRKLARVLRRHGARVEDPHLFKLVGHVQP